VEPIALQREVRDRLDRRFLIFYTGITRSASEILSVQSNHLRNDAEKSKAMARMVDYARELRDELWRGNIDAMGRILHENWLLKQGLSSGISSPQINDWYEAARKAGAEGGKLLGAGGGGFLLFYAPEEKHAAIGESLNGLRRIETHLEPRGSRILFVN
jgi:D-glycero-alpha-D-manno-heptose-7-phosphate kinase